MFDFTAHRKARVSASIENGPQSGLQILYFLTSASGMPHEMIVKSVVGCAWSVVRPYMTIALETGPCIGIRPQFLSQSIIIKMNFVSPRGRSD